jgi:hypothetical protein
MILAGLFLVIFFTPQNRAAYALDLMESAKDVVAIGAAYTTHLFFHELGHQVVADEVGADSHRMNFFTSKNGKFYLGLSTYKDIPEESKLSYAVGGERMASLTFEFGLQSYRQQPTTFNKTLMFLSGINFLAYTVLSNYISPYDEMYDPNLIRAETGFSKGWLLSMVTVKSLLNAYRVMDEDADFMPMVWTDKKSAGLAIRFEF